MKPRSLGANNRTFVGIISLQLIMHNPLHVTWFLLIPKSNLVNVKGFFCRGRLQTFWPLGTDTSRHKQTLKIRAKLALLVARLL